MAVAVALAWVRLVWLPCRRGDVSITVTAVGSLGGWYGLGGRVIAGVDMAFSIAGLMVLAVVEDLGCSDLRVPGPGC